MSAPVVGVPKPDAPRVLMASFLAALLVEGAVVTAIAWHQHWLAHPQANSGLDESRFVEAQIFEVPSQAQLNAQIHPEHVTRPTESALSHRIDRGRRAPPAESVLHEHNETQASAEPGIGATHGPVPIFNPAPVIPAYLQAQELDASVRIEFLITAQGAVTARLLESSGNEELDAIALATVKRWQFRPAEKDHVAIDSRTRLKIVFEIH